MADPTEIHLSVLSENLDEEPVPVSPEPETQKTLRTSWQNILIVILVVLLVAVSIVAGTTRYKAAQLRKENNCDQLKLPNNFTHNNLLYNSTLQGGMNVSLVLKNSTQEEEQLSTHLNNTLQEKTQLILLLNNTLQEKTQLSTHLNNTLQEKTQLSTHLNNTLQEKTQLSMHLNNTLQEKTQLSTHLNNTLQEKTQLSMHLNNTLQEKTQLSMHLNNTLQEKTQLSTHLNNTLQEKTQLSMHLNNTLQEKTQLSMHLNNTLQEKTQLSMHLNNTLQEKTQLILLLNNTLQEKTQLSMHLNNTLQEKTQLSMHLNNTLEEKSALILLLNNMTIEKSELQVETDELKELLNSTLENCLLLEQGQKKFQQLWVSEQQTTTQLRAENQRQRSILLSDKLSFIWLFCNRHTLQCSRCLPGWTEHRSRCFYLPSSPRTWENARKDCLTYGGDLAVVLDETDQAFLTNMTYQFVQQLPLDQFRSAWIGLQDLIMDGRFMWVNGIKVKPEMKYWGPQQPDNVLAPWDKDRAGQDCVTIVPPRNVGEEGWLNSWDDVVCRALRYYICETQALILE